MVEPCSNNCSFCFVQYTDIMSNENLFKNLDKSEIAHIIRNVHHQVRSYKEGDVIICENDSYASLIILIQGSVTTEMMNADGQVLALEQLTAPATLAPATLFASQPQIPVSVVANRESKVLLISRESMSALLASNNQVLFNFMQIISNRVQFLSERLKMLQFQSLRSKVMQYLLQLQKQQGSVTVVLTKTQQELSELFGVARPSLARVIRELHNDGVIEAKGKSIQIINKNAV